MKNFIIIGIALFVISGCASRPVAMKTDTKYFAPVRTTAQAKSSKTKQTMRIVSLASAEKTISEKNVVIDLLKKENQKLRDRIAKLEKKLAITNS